MVFKIKKIHILFSLVAILLLILVGCSTETEELTDEEVFEADITESVAIAGQATKTGCFDKKS